eukprot:Selendium_serpulae@DN5705_c0_g1_i3.p1
MRRNGLPLFLLGAVAVADAAFENSKSFIHAVEFAKCKGAANPGNAPNVGVVLNVAEAGDFKLHFWNGNAEAEAAVAVSPVHLVPGQLNVTPVQMGTPVDSSGGAFYLVDPHSNVVDCIFWGTQPADGLSSECTDTELASNIESKVYYIDPAATFGAYVGEVRGDFSKGTADHAYALCMSEDPSVQAAFAGRNVATAFVNEIVKAHNCGGDAAISGFEVAVYGAGLYTLYAGDGQEDSTLESSYEFPAGLADQWNFHTVELSSLGLPNWGLEFGYAVLVDTETEEVMSSMGWGSGCPGLAHVNLKKSGVVTIYPLGVSWSNVGYGYSLSVTGTDMENKSTGTWTYGQSCSWGAANNGQSFVTPTTEGPTEPPTEGPTDNPDIEATTEGTDGGRPIPTRTPEEGRTTGTGEEGMTTMAQEPDTGSGRKSKIGILAVLGSLALVLGC